MEAQPPLTSVEGVAPPSSRVRWGKRLLLLMWLASLALPAAWNSDGHPDWNDATGTISGLEILLLGWTDLGWGTIGWLGNWFFLAFLVMRLEGAGRYRRSAMLAGLLGLALIGTMAWQRGDGPDGWVQTPGGIGYAIWITVMVVAALWTALAAIWGYRTYSAAIRD